MTPSILPDVEGRKKFVFIDFEYRDVNEKFFELVCCSWVTSDKSKVDNIWLFNHKKNKGILKEKIKEWRTNNYIFVAFRASSEARCLITLNIDPVKCYWVDLYLEDRMVTNHWVKYMFGDQLFSNPKTGEISYKKTRFVPLGRKYKMTQEEKESYDQSKPQNNLLSSIYRMTGKKPKDEKQKKRIRDIIIKGENIEENKEDILKYCDSDVEELPTLLKAFIEAYRRYFKVKPELKITLKEMLKRGEYAALNSLIESNGYPVNSEWLINLESRSKDIFKEIMLDINSQFDEDLQPFRKDMKGKKGNKKWTGKLIKTESVQRDWIDKCDYASKWPLTETGRYSLKLEAWEKFYSYRGEYPRGNFAAQIVRFLKFKKSFNGFLPNSKDKVRNKLGSDSRVRFMHNIYKSQSARTQQSATYFIPLKARWTRSLVQCPEKNKYIVAIDYTSEEVLVQAILSGDKKLYSAYCSGDIYLSFAKDAGAVPENATKKTHGFERDVFKQTFLSISYGQGANSLALKLSESTGKKVTVEEAQEKIDLFFNVYSDYGKYLESYLKRYQLNRATKLPMGWVMFGGNDNIRSVKNVPIQGASSDILREAVANCYREKIKVIYTLHDAVYAEFDFTSTDKADRDIKVFNKCLIKAFNDVLQNPWSKSIRTDIDAWGKCLKDVEIKDVNTYELYIDERVRSYTDKNGNKVVGDYERFSKYFL